MGRKRKGPSKSKAAGLALAVVLAALIFFLKGPGRKWISDWGGSLSDREAAFTAGSLSEEEVRGVLLGGLPKTTQSLKILGNEAFVLAYDEERSNPAWVAYRISGSIQYDDYSRARGFTVDERTRSRVSHKDYTGSGYSRGHMAPSYAVFSRFGDKAKNKTYLMSNIVPQDPGLNSGKWAQLERKVSGTSGKPQCWASALKEIWVVTGPVYDEKVERLPSGVEIPDKFFKILVDRDEKTGGLRSLAFLMPNRRADQELEDFLVSVDRIESLTGQDFFWELPDEIENPLEAEAAEELWALN